MAKKDNSAFAADELARIEKIIVEQRTPVTPGHFNLLIPTVEGFFADGLHRVAGSAWRFHVADNTILRLERDDVSGGPSEDEIIHEAPAD